MMDGHTGTITFEVYAATSPTSIQVESEVSLEAAVLDLLSRHFARRTCSACDSADLLAAEADRLAKDAGRALAIITGGQA
jgi:hypothetical protein